eukprot:gene19293-23103_t
MSNLHEDEELHCCNNTSGPSPSLNKSAGSLPLPSSRINSPSAFQEYQATNRFLTHAKELSTTTNHNLIIGESFPYRCQLFLADKSTKVSAYLYFLDSPLYESTGRLSMEDILIRSTDTSLESILTATLRSAITSSPTESSLITIANLAQTTYQSNNGPSQPIPKLYPDVVALFPSTYHQIPTITTNDYLVQLQQMTSNIANTYNTPLSIARNLLSIYKWNPKTLLRSVKTVASYGPTDIATHRFIGTPQSECSICYCDIEPDQCIEFLCGHQYCTDCVAAYLSASIGDGNGGSAPIRCPSKGCPVMIDEVTVSTCVGSGRFRQYQSLLINDVIFLTKSKWCPSANCNRLFYPNTLKNVIPYAPCLCGETLCLYCGKKDIHWPSPCSATYFENSEYV